jgi:hypothetical protein
MTAPLYYDWQTKPVWGEDLDSRAFGPVDQGSTNNIELAPYSQDFTQGHDTINGRLGAARRLRAAGFVNGNFCDNRYQVPLFINKVSIDFSISGSTAQSQRTRDFYPHHFVLPGFQIQGQCYDQHSYGALCEFVHAAQHRGLSNDPNYLIQLYIEGDVYPRIRGRRNNGVGVTYGYRFHPNQIIKGQHEHIICHGYIMSMDRVHQTGVFAPSWQTSFMVVDMLSGPYKDNTGYQVQTANWIDLLTQTGSQQFSTKANEALNTKNLAWAAANSGNVISTNVGGGASAGGGGASVGGGTGQIWEVKASAELASSGNGWTELSSNGNGAAAAGLTQSPSCTGNSVSGCDFATLGRAYPHGTQLIITNTANGKSGTFPLTDVGNGSSFGPAIGLTPTVQSALGWDGSSTVRIQLASGGSLSVVPGFGKLVK